MKIPAIFSALVLLAIALSHCKTTSPAATAPSDRFAAERSRYVVELRADIQGKEQMAVDSVFSNLQVLHGFPAENLVLAMDKWGQALGVGCGYCHDTGNWAADTKAEKDIARQMVNLGNRINEELRSMKNLPGERPTVNCFTCHRGQKVPALRMN